LFQPFFVILLLVQAIDYRIFSNPAESLNIAQMFDQDHYILIFYSLAKGSPTF